VPILWPYGLKRNQNAVKATVNGFLRDAIRDVDVALVCLRGEEVSPALKAQREELKAIKAGIVRYARPARVPTTR
jgi:hypothetical protein